MTLKTSLFNKGIYKSALRRYLWGSLLYFIILFVATTLPILLAYDPSTVIGNHYPVLYDNGFLILSILLAMVVPTVVGLLIFRFIHSKKTSIFMHSLPVGRTAIFVSSTLAGLTLMCVPVLLNGIILGIMSFVNYAVFIPFGSVVCWTLINLLALFTMFACTCFVSSLTGNSFAMIALNILFHGIIPLTCAALGVFAETFLYGFTDISDLITKVADGNLIVRLLSRAGGMYTYYRHGIPAFGLDNLWEILAATILFVLAWFLYKKRNLENAEDVAGFKILNPIFKYLITFLAAICAFALFSTFITENPAVFVLVLAIVSAVAYVASEMVLKKTIKVWKSYKGYIAFAVAFTAMTCLFTFTSFFGYETRVPAPDEVKSVAVYNYYNYEEPYVEGDEIIETAINVHKKLIDKTKFYTIKPYDRSYHTRIHIKYKLRNGREIRRAYWVDEAERYEIIGGLYEFAEYRLKHEGLVSEKAEDVYRINIYNTNGDNVILTEPKEIKGLHEALSKDLMSLEYNEIYTDYNFTHLTYEINRMENMGKGVNVPYTETAEKRIEYADADINTNFKNTHKWLADNGYIEYSYYTDMYGTVYIAQRDKLEKSGYRYEYLAARAPMIKSADMINEDCIYLSQASKDKLEEYLRVNYLSYIPGEKEYEIFCSREKGGYEFLGAFDEEEIKKIIEQIIE